MKTMAFLLSVRYTAGFVGGACRICRTGVRMMASSAYFTSNTLLAEQHPFLSLQQRDGLPSDHMACWLDLSPEDGALGVSFTGDSAARRQKPFSIDFASNSSIARQKQAHNELIVKSVGKAPIVVDMTAGLCRDAMMLAAAGKQVVCCEQHPVIHALLQDALLRLSAVNPKLAKRVLLLHGNSCESLDAIRALLLRLSPDLMNPVTVVLDPMYPTPPSERKALVKKETQVLHRLTELTGHQGAGDQQLFQAARAIATDRIVVKRDLHDAELVPGLVSAHGVNKGRTQRFDLYFANRLALLDSAP